MFAVTGGTSSGSRHGKERPSSVDASRGPVTAVAIQDRSRFFREGLRFLLNAHSGLRVDDEMALLAQLDASRVGDQIDAVILEATGVPWDVPEIAGQIMEGDPNVVIVGTYPDRGQPHNQIEGVRLVHRNSPSSLFASILMGRDLDGSSVYSPRGSGSDRDSDNLTTRELQVLALIGGGLTSTQIAERMGISVKTVESKRQALFAKLGVQNQSAAVAVAIRQGLLGAGFPHPGTPRSR